MPRPRVVIAATSATVVAASLVLAAPAQAAPIVKSPLFAATATGLAVNLLGGLANSGPYSPVAITTRSTAKVATNSTAAATIPGVLSTGGIATDTSTARNSTNIATYVTGHARTAGLNLLNGAVTLDAVDTTARLTVKKTSVVGIATTTFTNLRISGQSVINGQVAPNTTIEVPGVARVVLNASGVAGGSNSGMAVATGIIITLLGGSSVGSTIAINSTTAQTQFVSQFYAPLNGIAFSAMVTAGNDTSLSVGPLGAIGMPSTGTGGQTQTATLAASPLLGLGTLGAGSSTAYGTVSNSGSRSTMTNTITGLNLLGGLITADAVTSTADVRLHSTGTTSRVATVNFVNLKVAGTSILANVAPNTTIALPGVGGVVLRGTATTESAAASAALTISLSTAAFGLPAGATITVGFAYSSVVPNDL